MSINSINGSVSLGVPPQVDEEGNVITQDPDSDIKDPSAIQTDKINTPDSETIDDDIAFKGSIQFRFALYQLNYANQCRQNAVNYMGQIEQVQDQAAAVANKVAVGGDDAVKPLLPLDHAHALDVAVLLEKDQIAVDRPQTQIRVGGLQLVIDPLGGGVAIGAPDGGKDRLPLFAVSDGALHGSLP